MMIFLTTTVCGLTMLSSWLCSRGLLKPAYILGIAMSGCYVAINVSLASTDTGVVILVIPSAWRIITSYLGLRRLKKARTSDGH